MTDLTPTQRAALALLARQGVPYLWEARGFVLRVTLTAKSDAAPKVYVGIDLERV